MTENLKGFQEHFQDCQPQFIGKKVLPLEIFLGNLESCVKIFKNFISRSSKVIKADFPEVGGKVWREKRVKKDACI